MWLLKQPLLVDDGSRIGKGFWKRFAILRKFVSKSKYWKRSNFAAIVTYKYADLSNRWLFWKFLVPLFRTTYALSVGFKIKPLRNSVFLY